MSINWDLLIAAIATIETGSTGPVPGDGGRAIGPLQIHQCVVDDVNRIAGSSLKHSDMTEMKYAAFACRVYLAHWSDSSKKLGHEPTIEELGRIWNGGPLGPKRQSTADYGRRVAATYENLVREHRLKTLLATASNPSTPDTRHF